MLSFISNRGFSPEADFLPIISSMINKSFVIFQNKTSHFKLVNASDMVVINKNCILLHCRRRADPIISICQIAYVFTSRQYEPLFKCYYYFSLDFFVI